MLLDKENHKIQLLDQPNRHMLIWGQSGQGKTYYCCRRIEDEVRAGRRVLIFDYSGSFTEGELQKSEFQYSADRVSNFDIFQAPYFWMAQCTDRGLLIEDLRDALVSTLGITSYFQKKLLRQALDRHFERKSHFCLPEFIVTLEEMLNDRDVIKEALHNADNITFLLTRLQPYDGVGNLKIRLRIPDMRSKKRPVTILQMSEFPELQRRFITTLLATLLWKDIKRGGGEKKFDVVLFDEFQFLSVEEDSALSQILREGRKYDLTAILSSQFVSGYSREEQLTLFQAGHKMIFRPAENDLRYTAKTLNPQEYKAWENILSKLRVGEAVLSGDFMLENGKAVKDCPVICRIRLDNSA